MLDRKQAENELKKVLETIIGNRFFNNDCSKLLQSKYKMPPSIAFGILNNYKVEINMVDDKTLFQLMSCVEEAGRKYNIQHISLKQYFTEVEIKSFSSSKYEQEKKAIYPIEIPNCIEVNPGTQWITTMTAKELDRLNQEGIINYNKNTQRNLTKKKVGNKYEYVITLKQKSVNEIRELMKEGRYISDDITFNLNWDDPNLDFNYDDESKTIVVSNGKLDIIDGYHRFRALISSVAKDENFDYNMVVNIMYFDEEKANRYIVQKDKRNKINPNHLKSLDTQNPVNMLVKRLNEDSSSYLCGHIGREDEEGKITFSHLFNWIDNCYKIKERKDAIQLTKSLKNMFNSVIEEGIKVEDLGFKEIGIIVMCASMYDEYEALEKIKEKLDNANKLDNDKFSRRVVNKRTMTLIKDFVEED